MDKQNIQNLISKIRNDKLSYDDLVELSKKYKIKVKSKNERLLDALKYKITEFIPYPTKDDPDFFRKLYFKKEFQENKYKLDIDLSKDPQKQLCPSEDKKFQLLTHQILMRNYINVNTPYNGVLLFHGLGSGKTCSSITIAESYKKSLEDISSNRILVLVSGDTIEENFRKQVHNIEKGYNQCTFSDYINYNPYDSKEVKQQKSDTLIDKNYEFEHYQRLSNRIDTMKKSLKLDEFKKSIEQTYSNRVFIIDEVHNLKLKELKEDGKTTIKRYEAVKTILQYANNIKLILLSGTPMSHDVREIIDILNLLLINDKLEPLSPKKIFDTYSNLTAEGELLLKKYSKGYISYITSENPYTFPAKKYPKNAISSSVFIEDKFNKKLFININVDKELKIIPCKMIGDQRKMYLKYVNEPTSKIGIQELVQLQLISYDYTKSDKKSAVYDIPFDNFKESNIQNISTKYYELLQNVRKSPGPIFIYTNYNDKGIYMIASMFLQNGIDLFKSRDDDKSVPFLSSSFRSKRVRPGANNQICAFCAKKRNQEHVGHIFKPMLFDFIIGKTRDEVQKKIISTFNQGDNVNGERLKIIIGSSVLKEGVSFFKVRQLHIMEPWHNKSRMDQIIGRGLRFCSHKDLPEDQRNIELYLYCSVVDNKYEYNEVIKQKDVEEKITDFFTSTEQTKIPIEYAKPIIKKQLPLLSYDLIMYKRLEVVDYYIKKVELLLKKNAIDCALNKRINIDTLPDGEQYLCESFPTEKDYKIQEEEIDMSTYNNLFLTPYIKYTISIIKQLFESSIIIYENELKTNPKLSDMIYQKNNHYVIRKALQTIVPVENNIKDFKYILTHKNRYGYLLLRKIGNDNVYIFKEFDNQEKISRSIFEVSPLYDRIYQSEEKIKPTLKSFLGLLERREMRKKGQQLYYKVITTTQEIDKTVGTSNIDKMGMIPLELIKVLDPYTEHKNDGEYVMIVIDRPEFEGKMWVRKTSANAMKKGSNIKQYSYGRVCDNYDKKEINNMIIQLWKKIQPESNFYKQYLNEYNKYSRKGKKGLLCNFLSLILKELERNKVDNKRWFKKLK